MIRVQLLCYEVGDNVWIYFVLTYFQERLKRGSYCVFNVIAWGHMSVTI